MCVLTHSWRPERNGWHFADNIFKYISLKEKVCVFNKIFHGYCYYGSTFVQVMAWHGTKIQKTASSEGSTFHLSLWIDFSKELFPGATLTWACWNIASELKPSIIMHKCWKDQLYHRYFPISVGSQVLPSNASYLQTILSESLFAPMFYVIAWTFPCPLGSTNSYPRLPYRWFSKRLQ